MFPLLVDQARSAKAHDHHRPAGLVAKQRPNHRPNPVGPENLSNPTIFIVRRHPPQLVLVAPPLDRMDYNVSIILDHQRHGHSHRIRLHGKTRFVDTSRS